MQQWEYLTIRLQGIEPKSWMQETYWDADYFSQQLNYFGAQGWELVSCFNTIRKAGYGSTTDGVFAMFKRTKGA